MKTLLSKSQIQDGVAKVATEITAMYSTQSVTIVGVLTGALVFMADLIRHLEMPLHLGFLSASSYRGSTIPGLLEINSDLMPDVTDQHVLLVDDIFDTGHTLLNLIQLMREAQVASIHSAVLLQKVGRREVDYVPDVVGFDIPDEFVVGYGMDFKDLFRNLPYVAVLEPDETG